MDLFFTFGHLLLNRFILVSTNKKTNVFAFVMIIILFFLWGTITSINDILVPTYKKVFDLSDSQSSLILFSFFGAYGLGALFYYIYSNLQGDPINKIGYKRGMLLGLIVSGMGCISLYPITATGNYYASLTSFFIIGLGLTLLQITCNPYVAILGSRNTASSRLNLSQGFNSLGTTIGPLIAGYLIAQYATKLEAVQELYLICGLIFFSFAVFLWKTPLPHYAKKEEVQLKDSALKFSHVRFGMWAIFFYVGAEVMIGGKLFEFVRLPQIGNLSELEATSYLGIYWGGAMIGRLGIAVISSDKFGTIKKVIYGFLTIAISYLVIVLFIALTAKILKQGKTFDWELIASAYTTTLYEIRHILWFIGLQFITMLIFRNSSRLLLSACALFAAIALGLAFIFKGQVALWLVLSIGLFNSIMWSNIFTLAIDGLKEYTSQASSLLVIMIVGGAILPVIMGWIIDQTGRMEMGYLFPIISYLYILYFGLAGYRIKQKI